MSLLVFSQAIHDDDWRRAMTQEIYTLEDNATWVYMTLPLGKRALRCKWVHKIKYHGTIECYKVRPVIIGNIQVEGEYYHKTFSLVAKIETIPYLLSITVSQGWELHQIDVYNVFLHGDLKEELYMKPPPGF